jgi:hypothetical protein
MPVKTEGLKEKIQRLQEAYIAEMSAEMKAATTNFVQDFDKRKHNGRPGVFVRTGAMARSFQPIRYPDMLTTGCAYVGNKYAATHEYGDKRRPARARFLAIPLDAAKTARGVMSQPPRAWKGAFFIRSKKGNILLVMRKKVGLGKKARVELVPLFVLKKRVRIPARLGLRAEWKKYWSKRGRGMLRLVARQKRLARAMRSNS